MTRAWAVALLLTSACATRPPLQVRPQFIPSLALPSVGPVPTGVDALHGRVVLVNFMATWCLPCLQELPDLVALQQRFGARGFTVVMVGMDLEGEVVLAPFAEHYALPFPLLVADGTLRSGQSAFGQISILPTSYLIGKDGGLRAQFVGIAEVEALEGLIASALER